MPALSDQDRGVLMLVIVGLLVLLLVLNIIRMIVTRRERVVYLSRPTTTPPPQGPLRQTPTMGVTLERVPSRPVGRVHGTCPFCGVAEPSPHLNNCPKWDPTR